MKKLALVATAATALICAAALVTTSAEAKKHHHKKPAPAAAPTGQWAGGPGMGDRHDLGGPRKSSGMCWKDKDPWANTGQGYWGKC